MDAGIYAARADYLDRSVQLGVAGDRVISVSFPREADPDASDDHPLLERVRAYLEGVEDDFTDVGLTVPTDQRAVLETVRGVGYGESVTVEAAARATPGLDADDEADRQLARTALADNPLPLLVPDHRVRNAPSGAPPEVEQKLRALEGL